MVLNYKAVHVFVYLNKGKSVTVCTEQLVLYTTDLNMDT